MKIGQGYVFFEPVFWWVLVVCLIIAFGLGWIFPVEGPLDYVYDKYASQPAHKRPVVAPAVKQDVNLQIDLNDLSEEDFEALMEIFSNYGK